MEHVPWTQVGGQPSRRREEATQALPSSTPKSPTYLMALLNLAAVRSLGACSLRYPYFSRNDWGREECQLSHGVASFPLPWSPRVRGTCIMPCLTLVPMRSLSYRRRRPGTKARRT